jgi:hypothetical protein
MKLTEFALVVLLGLAAQTASALGEPAGRWRTSDAPDGMKAGVVFPDFSENDFVGMFLRCARDGGLVEFSLDSRDKMKSGANARVMVSADGVERTYSGHAQNAPMDDQTRIVFTTGRNDPLVDALRRARSIHYAVNGKSDKLPADGIQEALSEFMKKCGL